MSALKNPLDFAKRTTTYKSLGGPEVTREVLVSELRRQPIDGVLGFLGRLSYNMVHNRRPTESDEQDFRHPFQQAPYLIQAIADDFRRLAQLAHGEPSSVIRP